LSYLDKLIVGGHPPSQDLGLLVTPLVAAIVLPAAAWAAAGHATVLSRERS
jgi:hypothetical protein